MAESPAERSSKRVRKAVEHYQPEVAVKKQEHGIKEVS
jgi:hypothetical protein